MSNNSNYLVWLSSLRGLLVLLVFLSHQTILPLTRDLLFCLGKIGVAGFFIMSGYLVKASIERRNLKQFALNRFLRLYPVYWVLLIMKFIVAECAGGANIL